MLGGMIPGLDKLPIGPQLLGKVGELKDSVTKTVEETKDKSILDRVQIIIQSFVDKIKSLFGMKKKVTKKASEGVKKNVSEVMKAADEKLGLKDDAKLEENEKNIYRETLAMGVAAIESLDNKHQGEAYSAIEKLDIVATSGKAESLGVDEVRSLAASGLLTFKKLREKYDRGEFLNVMKVIFKAAPYSKYPFSKLMSNGVSKVFDIPTSELTGAQDMLPALGIVGKDANGMEVLGSAMEAKSLLALLKEKDLSKDRDEFKKVVAFMKPAFFPTSDAEKAVKIINKIVRKEKGVFSPESLTDLVFSISKQDTDRLIDILLAKKKV